MNEPHILCLETATNVCSVALGKGNAVVAIRETDEDRSHGTLLTQFMEEILSEAGINASELDAVALSIGPGSYTGLRIGASVAKGFAYASNIPVIGIDTLQVMASSALVTPEVKSFLENEGTDALLCPLIDARRMEVYSAIYNLQLEKVRDVEAEIIDETSFSGYLKKGKVLFFGNGSDKMIPVIQHANAVYINNIYPSSQQMIRLAGEKFRNAEFLDTAYFEPFYLKDFIATIPRKKVF